MEGFPVGAWVEIEGLTLEQFKPLNGLHGPVVGLHHSGVRVLVSLSVGDTPILPQNLKISPQQRCPREHVMRLSADTDGAYEAGWTCDNCTLFGDGQRWHCSVCEYDRCIRCTPLPAGSPRGASPRGTSRATKRSSSQTGRAATGSATRTPSAHSPLRGSEPYGADGDDQGARAARSTEPFTAAASPAHVTTTPSRTKVSTGGGAAAAVTSGSGGAPFATTDPQKHDLYLRNQELVKMVQKLKAKLEGELATTAELRKEKLALEKQRATDQSALTLMEMRLDESEEALKRAAVPTAHADPQQDTASGGVEVVVLDDESGAGDHTRTPSGLTRGHSSRIIIRGDSELRHEVSGVIRKAWGGGGASAGDVLSVSQTDSDPHESTLIVTPAAGRVAEGTPGRGASASAAAAAADVALENEALRDKLRIKDLRIKQLTKQLAAAAGVPQTPPLPLSTPPHPSAGSVHHPTVAYHNRKTLKALEELEGTLRQLRTEGLTEELLGGEALKAVNPTSLRIYTSKLDLAHTMVRKLQREAGGGGVPDVDFHRENIPKCITPSAGASSTRRGRSYTPPHSKGAAGAGPHHQASPSPTAALSRRLMRHDMATPTPTKSRTPSRGRGHGTDPHPTSTTAVRTGCAADGTKQTYVVRTLSPGSSARGNITPGRYATPSPQAQRKQAGLGDIRRPLLSRVEVNAMSSVYGTNVRTRSKSPKKPMQTRPFNPYF